MSNLLVWIQKHGHTQVGQPYKTYINQLALDTAMQISDLKSTMKDWNVWRQKVNIARATLPIW